MTDLANCSNLPAAKPTAVVVEDQPEAPLEAVVVAAEEDVVAVEIAPVAETDIRYEFRFTKKSALYYFLSLHLSKYYLFFFAYRFLYIFCSLFFSTNVIKAKVRLI